MDVLNRKPRVFGYIRASTDKQDKQLAALKNALQNTETAVAL